MNVLFFSEMTVSPASGGGHTVFNLLEPAPKGCAVYYATPTSFPPHWAPFPQIHSRICPVSNDRQDVIPIVPRGKRFRPVKRANALIAHMNAWLRTEKAVRQVLEHIRRLRIDVLLASPQSVFDLTVTVKVVRRSRVPVITWFMDDYFTDDGTMLYQRELWRTSRNCFVISEAMQRRFARLFSKECAVLNNSVPFPDHWPESSIEPHSRLRIIYAGSLNSYYLDTLRSVLDDLKDLREEIVLDIYSPEGIPAELSSGGNYAYRHVPAIPAPEMRKRLLEYDVLLILSSFLPQHRAIAETSLASKWADSLASGRCILAYGPEYAENVCYARRYGLGEVVTSNRPGALRDAVVRLAVNRQRRLALGRHSYQFGQERHNQATNSSKLWKALQQEC